MVSFTAALRREWKVGTKQQQAGAAAAKLDEHAEELGELVGGLLGLDADGLARGILGLSKDGPAGVGAHVGGRHLPEGDLDDAGPSPRHASCGTTGRR